MVSRTKKSRTTKKSNSRPLGVFNDPPTPRFLKLIVAAIAIGFLVWVLLFSGGYSRYSVDSDKVEQRFQTTLQAIQLPGKQLALGTEDQGCDSGTSVGLQTRILCSMEGYRYFEITGNVKEALQIADSKLEELGFERSTGNMYSKQVLDGSREGDINYRKSPTGADLSWSSLSGGENGPRSNVISRALSSHKIESPDEGATIVGVVLRETYWSCTSGGVDILGVGCSFPPHTPNKH